MTIPSVAHTAEFRRVASLPRRVWNDSDLAYLASSLTEILKTPGGTMKLRPVQALALHDAGIEGGLFGPIGVGEGKTLCTLLLPLVLNAQRPLLLMPAGLIGKTQRERFELSKHWRIPNSIRVFSVEMLGRVQSADELETYSPDLIVVDEVHKLKNKRAACTRRVARYMHAHPQTHFCGLSGTVMDKSLKEFMHLLFWSLKLGAPVPVRLEEQEEWAEALDQSDDPLTRLPGALLEFCNEEEKKIAGAGYESARVAARRAFRRRLTETPGIVATVGEGEHVDCSIYVRGIIQKAAPVTEANFAKLRQWKLPDDWDIDYAVEVWRHAQELALGLHYEWEVRPPEEWREARKAWGTFVRQTISQGRTYDSELHVANACDAGKLDGSALTRWRAVRDTFIPKTVAVWHDDSALKACADWMRTPGLVWTEHKFFAEKLSKLAGIPYFGAKGLDAAGRPIEGAKPGTSAIASIDACREGRNLQKLWNRNLLVCPPASAAWMEQTIARTHRPGQEADEVIVDVLLGCRENYDACIKALEGARAIQDTTGKTQKLLLADVTLPTQPEIDALRTPRWMR